MQPPPLLKLITARIRRMGEGNIFSLSTLAGRGGVPCPRSVGGWGVPHPRSWWGGTPSQIWMVGRGIPLLTTTRTGWGRYPPHPPIRQSSIASTCTGQCASCVHAGGLSCIEFFIGHQFAQFSCGSMICSYVIGIKIPSQFCWL